MSDLKFEPKERPASYDFVRATLQPYLTQDAGRSTLSHYVEDGGQRKRSLAAKQFGRALAIALNQGDGKPCSIKEDPEDDNIVFVTTQDPIMGASTHVVLCHAGKPWEVFGVQREAGNHVRYCTPAFARWCEGEMPEYNKDGSPRNLAAMNAQNCAKWAEYRPRFADLSMDKHLLAVALMSEGQKFYVPPVDGDIPEFFWIAVAEGYESELASWQPKAPVFPTLG